MNEVCFTTDFQKALALADQFRSVYTEDNGRLPECEQVVAPDSFCNISITDQDIIYAIQSMNADSAPGPDLVHGHFIKNVYCYLIQPLKLLFRKCIENGSVPEEWKKGIIVPLYKKNKKPENPSSYRPVCLTSIICKLLERIVHKYLMVYLKQKDLISPSQHAFLAKKSTGTNLIECLNDWTQLIDAKKPVDIVYIDLAKAFDSVSLQKLLFRLRKIGIGGPLMEFFRSFLIGRSNCVRIKRVYSPYEPVLSGIPQGTILGPALFILYINSIAEIPTSSTIQLYADDAKLYRGISSDEDAEQMQNDLSRVCDYFRDWQLNINTEKCELIHIGQINRHNNYLLDGQNIQTEQNCRDLGVKVSEDAKFSQHCNEIARSAFFRLKQMNISFSCKNKDFKLLLFKTYIRPLLENNTYVWSPHLLKDIDKIESVQRLFTRQMGNLRQYSYMERLRILNLESLEARRIMFDLVFLYKIVNSLVEIERESFFTMNSGNTRGHKFKINVQYARTNYRKYFFVNRTVRIWNLLPANIVDCNSVASFKLKLKSYDLNRFCRGRALMT